jgi:hypothetical protein
MSIRLLEAINIAGAHAPKGTIPVGLTVAQESDLVAQNKAVWVDRSLEVWCR